MTYLRPWIAVLHNRPSFSNGLTIPFPRPGFFGPPDALQADIEAEIARNAGQFAVMSKSLSSARQISLFHESWPGVSPGGDLVYAESLHGWGGWWLETV